MKRRQDDPSLELVKFIEESFTYLRTARPTAVNITEAALRFTTLARDLERTGLTKTELLARIYTELGRMLEDDVATNKLLGQHGAEHIRRNATNDVGGGIAVLTHCNTGSLACGGYGTALGVIRALHSMGELGHTYCTETRPYNQGSRLTAYELVHEKIPSTLICDSMAGFLMKEKTINAVIVGADRVVANGDTANKIGTYQLGVVAKHHNVPFYVASPRTTIDFSLASGSDIVIEERKHEEMTLFGGKRIAPADINCWNPAFDVTPADLITGGIITEYGVYEPHKLRDILLLADS